MLIRGAAQNRRAASPWDVMHQPRMEDLGTRQQPACISASPECKASVLHKRAQGPSSCVPRAASCSKKFAGLPHFAPTHSAGKDQRRMRAPWVSSSCVARAGSSSGLFAATSTRPAAAALAWRARSCASHACAMQRRSSHAAISSEAVKPH